MHGSGALRREGAKLCPQLSSLRTQGPITTGVSLCAKVVERRLSKQAARRMGPCVRRDDIEAYCFLRRDAAAAGAAVSAALASALSFFHRKISTASTG
jgi:hypothetical protein